MLNKRRLRLVNKIGTTGGIIISALVMVYLAIGYFGWCAGILCGRDGPSYLVAGYIWAVSFGLVIAVQILTYAYERVRRYQNRPARRR